MKKVLDEAGVNEQTDALCSASKQPFYNSSPFVLKDLTSRTTAQALKRDFIKYLDGFSSNAITILEKFKFRSQIETMIDADILGAVIEKFVTPTINLSPYPVLTQTGAVQTPGLDNHTMGIVFEELIRKFNEENNEEAGEHFTPRDVVDANLTDTEQIPLTYAGGICAFIQKEVLPYAPDAWVNENKTQIGYEISFTKHFYKPVKLRKLSEIIADIRELEAETDGLLEEILKS